MSFCVKELSLIYESIPFKTHNLTYHALSDTTVKKFPNANVSIKYFTLFHMISSSCLFVKTTCILVHNSRHNTSCSHTYLSHATSNTHTRLCGLDMISMLQDFWKFLRGHACLISSEETQTQTLITRTHTNTCKDKHTLAVITALLCIQYYTVYSKQTTSERVSASSGP